MKLSDKVGINPEYWSKQKESDFVSEFKVRTGFTASELKKVHKDLVSKFKSETKGVK